MGAELVVGLAPTLDRGLRFPEGGEQGALDGEAPISGTLRKVLALGGKVGSKELRDWASLELRGYAGSDVEPPQYRKPSAAIMVDFSNLQYMVKGQQIGRHQLPEPIREHVDEQCPLSHGIGEIEALLERAKTDGGSVKMSLPGAQIVANLMRDENVPDQQIRHIYWALGANAIAGVIDHVRTILVELVAEMRAGTPDTAEAPSAAAADRAVNVAVYGGKPNVNIASAQAGGDGSHHVHASSDQGKGDSRWAKAGKAILGLATIAGVIIALAQWQGWLL